MKGQIKIISNLLLIANEKPFTIVQLFVSRAIINIIELLPPIATAGIIALVVQKDLSNMWVYIGMYLGFYVVNAIVTLWNDHTFYALSSYYQLKVQQILFEHILKNNSIFKSFSRGEIVNTCSDDVRFLINILDDAASAISTLAQIVVIFFIFYNYNIYIALVALVINIIYISLNNRNSEQVAKYIKTLRKNEDKILDIFNQVLNNIKQIKSLNVFPSLNQKLKTIRADWQRQSNKKRDLIVVRHCNLPFVIHISKIILYAWLATLVVADKLRLDQLTLIISYFEIMVKKSESMLLDLYNLTKNGIKVNRIKKIMEFAAAENAINYGSLDNDKVKGLIEFRHVSYKLHNRLILDDISFTAQPNQITTIVGKPGSGKTTVMNLLYRIFRVNSGSILLDNENIYNYNQAVYNSNISGAFQKNFIFKMSIRENLALINPDHEAQIEVCKKVGLHKRFKQLPKGYNTILDEDDDILSEGEKQKFAIARALLSKSEVLLFDEVTSNIDPYSTTEIIKLAQKLKKDHTVIIVTHKPEVMRIADYVVVLNNGKVAAKGANREVYKKNKLYRELFNQTFARPSEEDDFDFTQEMND